jgi:hypothetical protein
LRIGAPTDDGPSSLLAYAAAFGRSLDEKLDPDRFLAEFSARAERPVRVIHRGSGERRADPLGLRRVRGMSHHRRGQRSLYDGVEPGRARVCGFALAKVFERNTQVVANMAAAGRFTEQPAPSERPGFDPREK